MVAGFGVVATVYASVGFGGGSSYLALLALFFAADPPLMRTTALLCNLIVVAGSVWLHARAGNVDSRRFGPFVAVSVPLAYAGAQLPLSREQFFGVLGVTLVGAGALLAWRSVGPSAARRDAFAARVFPRWTAPALGGGIGLLSGVVGIGGGIFLAPVLHYVRWARPAEVAALASLFILVNSAAGLAGLATAGAFAVDPALTPLCLGAVVVGGQLGARLGVHTFGGARIRLVTAALVGAVGLRILFTA